MLFDRLGPAWEAFQADARRAVRILVVDDEPSVCLLLAEVLGAAGFTVDTAASVAEARGRLEAGDYTLLVLDKNLPDGSGIDLLRFVRDAGNDVPVVIITAYPSTDTVVDALTMGASDYIAKPFDDLDHVLGRLGSVIDARIARHLNDRMVRDLAAVVEADGPDRDRLAAIAERLFAYKRELASRASVLVVEDNVAVAEVVRRTLSSIRLRTEVASDVRAAAVWLERSDGPLTALVSVDLPEALETVAALRARDPFLEVVVTTGSTDVGLALAAVGAGATDYVLRLFEGVEVLRGRMQRAVGRARRRRLYLHLIATLYRDAKAAGSGALDYMAQNVPDVSGAREEPRGGGLPAEEIDLADIFDSESELEVDVEVTDAPAPTVTLREASDGAAINEHERRRFRRVEANLDVRFKPLAAGKDDVDHLIYSHLKDISAGGMFIVMGEPLSPGTRLSVELDLGWGTHAVSLACEVMRQVTEADAGPGRSGIGVRFLEPDDPELKRLVEGLAQRIVPG